MLSSSENSDNIPIRPFFTQSGQYLTYHAKCAAIIPRITGTISFIGSLMTVYVLISGRKKMLSKVKNRIVFSMSCVDCLSSLAFIVSTAAIPRETPGVWGAQGTTATCDAQGFLFQLALTGPCYNCALSLYYLLVIRWNMKDKVISKRVEPFMHGFSVLFPLVTAIIGAKLGLFNAFGAGCYFQAHPYMCRDTEEYECTRGFDANTYARFFVAIPSGVIFFSIILFMTMLIYSVYSIEKRTEGHGFVSEVGTMHRRKSATHKQTRTRQTLKQALLYIGAYFITYVFSIIIFAMLYRGRPSPPFVSILGLIFQPLQGFWNFFIFMFPRYILVGKSYPEKSVWMKCYLTMKVFDRNDLRRKSIINRRTTKIPITL